LVPPQLEQITTKLKDKTYQYSGRLELFAYSIHDEPDGAVGGLEAIEQTIRQDIGTSKFDRVHVFHVGFLKHILTLPWGAWRGGTALWQTRPLGSLAAFSHRRPDFSTGGRGVDEAGRGSGGGLV
jgi:hypothetical protein